MIGLIGGIVLGELQPSSTASVSLIGGVVRARHLAEEGQDKKYPRDECPVCEGKGWYMSGDDIEKVDCGYCEPVKKEEPATSEPEENTDDPKLVPIKQYILR